jgi:hypothetical protein
MEAVAGVFRSVGEARGAFHILRSSGLSRDGINLLLPGTPEEQIHSVPVSETEQPGMGTAMGGVVGAALGLAGGAELGAVAAATSVIPGVGPVIALGLAGAALLGTAGAAIGSAAERRSTEGLPADEIFFYEDALRQGRAVIIFMAEGKREAERARQLMAESGAESIDAAREAWWIGLRDAEKEHYHALGKNFAKDHEAYRAGFEAALRPVCRGKAVDEALECLRGEYPKLWNTTAFRDGFVRGEAYRRRRETLVAR